MTLFELLDGVDVKNSIQDRAAASLTSDSRQVEKDSVFFCIQGQKFDGHDAAAGMLERGAAAVVVERDLGLREQVIVSNTREAYGIACGNYFGNPSRRLKLMGITGTNGKTTGTYLMKQILECAGKRVGLIGTIHNEIADMVLPAKYTTPDPIQLQAMFARMVEAGCEYVVMEVSSHALDQHRVAGCHFLTAAFTNLTQDHLDYHKEMEHYYQSKKRLFDYCDTAILNLDDPYGVRLSQEVGCKVLTYSCGSHEADYAAHNIKFGSDGSRFALMAGDVLRKVSFCMPGLFSVQNALAAAVSCLAAGVSLEEVIQGLASCTGVTGRMEILPTNTPYTVIRDYAHSPDGLKNVLETVREFAPGRVVTLFGCAGNRDRTKRPIMAEIAARLSDFCILTSDNPRDESPQRILDDAAPGFEGHSTPYKMIVDRYEAIQWALDNAQPDDILILAGKGHEDYQVLDFGTIHFDEREIVLGLLGVEKQARH